MMQLSKTIRVLLSGALASLLAGQLSACSFIVINRPEDTETSVPTTEDTTSTPQPPPPVTEDTDPTPPPPTAEERAADAKEALGALREADFGGINFIIGSHSESAAFGDGEARGSVLSRIRAEREKWVEERYHVKLLSFEYDRETMFDEVLAAYNSDSQYLADLYAIPPSELGKYQANGLIANLHSIPFTDLSKPYYDREAISAMTAGYGIWGAAGDYTYSPDDAYAVFFNRTLASEYGISSPYAEVEAGRWTWETYFADRALVAGAEEVWGDNLLSLGAEGANGYEGLMLAASGQRMTVNHKDTTPILNADTDILTTLATRMYENVTKGEHAISAEEDAYTLFSDGRLLFCIAPLSYMEKWADIDVKWGILPLPKADDTQEDYYTAPGDTAVIAVPSVLGEPEVAGTVMQGLFAAGYRACETEYESTALAYHLRDSASAVMLDYIIDGIHFDFTAMFSSGYPALHASTVGALHRAQVTRYTFEEVYAGNAEAANAELGEAFPTGRR